MAKQLELEDYKKILKDAEKLENDAEINLAIYRSIVKMAAHEIKKFDDVKVESKVSST